MKMQAAARPSSNYSIEPTDTSGIPVIIALAQRIWPACFGGIIEPEKIANMLDRIYNTENLTKEIREGHRFWITYDEKTPVGYVSAYKDGDSVWLKKIYLDPAYQGKGLGAQMMHTATSAFLPAKEIRLLVNDGNIAAQRFYERIGFARVKAVPVMMGDYEFTDYLYNKPLTE